MSDASEVLDAFLKKKHKYYPWVPYFILFCMLGSHSWVILSTSFTAWSPESFFCSNSSSNTTTSEFSQNETCEKYIFEEKGGLTMVVDFQLVCEHKFHKNLMDTMFLIGVMISNLLFGRIPDLIGRKLVTMASHWLLGLSTILIGLSGNIYMIHVLRCVSGVFYASASFTIWTWGSELFESQERLMPMAMLVHGWSLGLMSLPLLSWMMPAWRTLQFSIGSIMLLSVPLYFVMPESLYWLNNNNFQMEAKQIAEEIEKDQLILLGGKSLYLNKVKEKNPTTTPKGQRLSGTYVKSVIIFSSLFFAGGLIYFGLSFSTGEFVGNRHFNFFLFGLIELPATFLAYFLGRFTTRRFSFLVVHTACGIAMLISAVLRLSKVFAIVNNQGNEEDSNLGNTIFKSLNLVAKFFIACSFGLISYVPAEVYPTNYRNTSFNINAVFSRIAAMIGSFAPVFFRANAMASEAIFGCIGIMAGFITIWLPESKNQPLPQTMDDLDKMQQRTKNICNLSPRDEATSFHSIAT